MPPPYSLVVCDARLRQEGGLLLVAPEHRKSLVLKRLELAKAADGGDSEARSACAELDGVFATPFLDLVDECDEVLNHKYVCGLLDARGVPALGPRYCAYDREKTGVGCTGCWTGEGAVSRDNAPPSTGGLTAAVATDT